ncbi:MAG: hypothetical protein QXU99_04160 [Candidatus Bathyarchaeia archaeon]
MALEGYYSSSGDYCYIGFEGMSPFMINDLPDTGVSASYFPAYFYYKALGYVNPYHQTIHDSLDYASYITYGVAFDQTALYNGYWKFTNQSEGDPVTGWWFCHMRVFGNTNLWLP